MIWNLRTSPQDDDTLFVDVSFLSSHWERVRMDESVSLCCQASFLIGSAKYWQWFLWTLAQCSSWHSLLQYWIDSQFMHVSRVASLSGCSQPWTTQFVHSSSFILLVQCLLLVRLRQC